MTEVTMMQVFIRRLGESLCLGDEIEITILAVRDEEVRIGITAPKSVPIRRKETDDKKE